MVTQYDIERVKNIESNISKFFNSAIIIIKVVYYYSNIIAHCNYWRLAKNLISNWLLAQQSDLHLERIVLEE